MPCQKACFWCQLIPRGHVGCSVRSIVPFASIANPAKAIQEDPSWEKKGWLDLAQFMLSQRGNLDVARTAKFLIGLVTDPNPTEMVPLPWFATPSEVDPEPPRLPSSLDRLAPVMKFKATIRSVADDPRWSEGSWACGLCKKLTWDLWWKTSAFMKSRSTKYVALVGGCWKRDSLFVHLLLNFVFKKKWTCIPVPSSFWGSTVCCCARLLRECSRAWQSGSKRTNAAKSHTTLLLIVSSRRFICVECAIWIAIPNSKTCSSRNTRPGWFRLGTQTGRPPNSWPRTPSCQWPRTMLLALLHLNRLAHSHLC